MLESRYESRSTPDVRNHTQDPEPRASADRRAAAILIVGVTAESAGQLAMPFGGGRAHAVVAADLPHACRLIENASHDLLIVDVEVWNLVRLDSDLMNRWADLDSPLLVADTHGRRELRTAILAEGADGYCDSAGDELALLAEADALIRRKRRPSPIHLGDLMLDPNTREVSQAGVRVWLTPKEFELLHYLMRRPNRTVRVTDIARDVWGHAEISSRGAYKQVVRSLRRKLGRPGRGAILHTVLKEGYRLGA